MVPSLDFLFPELLDNITRDIPNILSMRLNKRLDKYVTNHFDYKTVWKNYQLGDLYRKGLPKMTCLMDFDIRNIRIMAKSGNLDLLKNVRHRFSDFHDVCDKLVLKAFSGGNLEVIKYLMSFIGEVPSTLNPILIATRKGHLEVIKYFLPLLGQHHVNSIFNYAVIHGHLNIIEYLIHVVNNLSPYISGAVFRAGISGNAELVKFLIEKGMDIHAYDDILLRDALDSGSVDIVKFLFDSGEKWRYNLTESLCIVTENAGLEVIKVKKIMGIKAAPYYIYCDPEFLEAIYTVRKGHLELVEYLVERGANIQSIHLMNAVNMVSDVKGAHFGVLKYFIERGADVSDGKIMENAAKNGCLDIIRLLAKHGADVNASNGEPLLQAILYGRDETVKLLISLGADVSINGYMAMKTAIKLNDVNIDNIDIIEQLITAQPYMLLGSSKDILIGWANEFNKPGIVDYIHRMAKRFHKNWEKFGEIRKIREI